MKIFGIGMYANPDADDLAKVDSVEFAHFSVVGTWNYRREPCDQCGYYWQEIISPLLVQWEPSSRRIGDFSWDGPFGYTFLLKAPVARRLNESGLAIKTAAVEYVKPDRKGEVVEFPYTGPQLVWAKDLPMVELDREASGVSQTSSCSSCGDVRYTFRDNGIIIRENDWQNHHIFRIATNGPALTFVTELGRSIIEREELTNISFREAGEIMR